MKNILRELLIGIISTIISTVILTIIFNVNTALIAVLYILLIIIAIYIIIFPQKSKLLHNQIFLSYKKYIQASVIVILILSTFLVYQSLHPAPPPTVPELEVRFVNNYSCDISILNRGEFFLTFPETPLMDRTVASGKILLQTDTDNIIDQNELVVPANEILIVYVNILNPSEYLEFLKRGDTNMILVFQQSNGEMLIKQGIPFDVYTLLNSYILLEVDSKTCEPTPTATPSPAPTSTATPSPAPTSTAIPSPTPTSTVTPSPTPTITVTPSPTPTTTPTATPSPTPTPSCLNVALATNGATISGGCNLSGRLSTELIDGQTSGYDGFNGYAQSFLNTSMTIIFKEIYTIDKVNVLLWDLDSRYYQYKVETSIDNSSWSLVLSQA